VNIYITLFLESWYCNCCRTRWFNR